MMKVVLILAVFFPIVLNATLKVHLHNPAHEISPHLFGIFLEEINHGLDGGLHAELIQNRALNPRGSNNLEGYMLVTSNPSNTVEGSLSISNDEPLNDVLRTSLRLVVNNILAPGERVGILNTGYWGIPIRPDYTYYNASFYAKATDNFIGPLTVTIESTNGSIIYASAIVPAISSTFEKYEVTLTPSPALIQNPTLDVVFVIAVDGNSAVVDRQTVINFQLVSLFPPTWRNKRNGLRIDIAEKLEAAKPSIVRFPGGSFLEGFESNGEITRYIWEETIGPIEQRPGHLGLWGYYASNGIGMLEYLELAEDLNATAVLGVYSGRSNPSFTYRPEELGPFVQSALNAIEYAIGNTSTTWGAVRASNGHPEPFPVPYVEIGNEDWFSDDYDDRFPLFYDAITEKYPEVTIVGTTYVQSRPLPVRDDHFYVGLGGFPARHTIYDDTPRNGSKVYIGEYATRDGDENYTGEVVMAHLGAAIEDATFMISMERNSDLIIMSSFAPLFCNVNDLRWTPDAIYFDGLSSYATPAWWVQHLFSTKRGNIYIPTDFDENPGTFFHSAALNTATNTIVVRFVNNGANDVNVDTELMGVCSTRGGKATVLTGPRFATNSLEEPMKISPTERPFTATTNMFTFNAPAYSLTIFEIEFDSDSCETSETTDTTSRTTQTTTTNSPNGGIHSVLHKYLLLSLIAYALLCC
ncbi:hypothetical protein HA402_011730 [Bradysia odoriphaga]|nr:hypothetical protein HA402_011730 [Bradysia odoriphaga]